MGEADAIIIGAGAGFSTSAGFVYNGEKFEKYFSDNSDHYHAIDVQCHMLKKCLHSV